MDKNIFLYAVLLSYLYPTLLFSMKKDVKERKKRDYRKNSKFIQGAIKEGQDFFRKTEHENPRKQYSVVVIKKAKNERPRKKRPVVDIPEEYLGTPETSDNSASNSSASPAAPQTPQSQNFTPKKSEKKSPTKDSLKASLIVGGAPLPDSSANSPEISDTKSMFSLMGSIFKIKNYKKYIKLKKRKKIKI